jgi:hypothetical protein
MLLFTPPDTDMQLPIGDDPQGEPGPDLAKVDQAAQLFYRYGHAGQHAIHVGGQMLMRSDRTWLACVRDTSGSSPVWALYAVVDRPIGATDYTTEPVSAVQFAQALIAQGHMVVVRRYDNYDITYSLDGDSVPL